MRSTRFNKFKSKNLTFMILFKMALIWYLFIFSTSYLTSNTAANFTANLDTNGTLSLGTWEEQDNSNLAFINNGNQNVKACEPTEVKVKLKNDGKGTMQKDSTYEVHYVKNGNPEKHGKQLKLANGEGNITALKSGDTTELSYKANKPGVYVFLANQTNGDLEKRSIWSKWVIVNCPGKKDMKVNDKAENEKPVKSEEKLDKEKEEVKEKEPVQKEKGDTVQKENTEKKEPQKENVDLQDPKTVKQDKQETTEEEPMVNDEPKSETKPKAMDTDQAEEEQDGDEA